MTNELAERDTLETLARVYQESIIKVEQAYTLLDEAQRNIRAAFTGDSFDAIPRNHYGQPAEAVKTIKKEWQQRAWRTIFNRSGMAKILSIKRREELDKQLSGERDAAPLPEVTAENILALIQDGMAKSTDYASEAVFEVFDWLRPADERYKTNNRWKLNNKIVISWVVGSGFGSRPFKIKYDAVKRFCALDNVFSMLDGKGPIKGYNGPLVDTIDASADGKGETEYFKFKCCKNGNLHLEFKRVDLVDKINYTAGRRDQIGGSK